MLEKQTLEKRLSELRCELERGQQQLGLLQQKRQEVHATVLRISGAVQVLEELLAEGADTNVVAMQSGAPSSET